MTPSKAIARRPSSEFVPVELTEGQLKVFGASISKSLGRTVTSDELGMLAHQCRELGLSPFRDEIGLAKWGSSKDAPIVPYVRWEGHLTLATRARGILGIRRSWSADAITWQDVWLTGTDPPPAVAKVELKLEGLDWPCVATATWRAWGKYDPIYEDATDAHGKPIWKETSDGKRYRVRNKIGRKLRDTWEERPDEMLSIKALRLACKFASRLTGTEISFEINDDEGHLRRKAFVLAKKIGLSDEDRHELAFKISEGRCDSWSPDAPDALSFEEWADLIAELEAEQETVGEIVDVPGEVLPSESAPHSGKAEVAGDGVQGSAPSPTAKPERPAELVENTQTGIAKFEDSGRDDGGHGEGLQSEPRTTSSPPVNSELDAVAGELLPSEIRRGQSLEVADDAPAKAPPATASSNFHKDNYGSSTDPAGPSTPEQWAELESIRQYLRWTDDDLFRNAGLERSLTGPETLGENLSYGKAAFFIRAWMAIAERMDYVTTTTARLKAAAAPWTETPERCWASVKVNGQVLQCIVVGPHNEHEYDAEIKASVKELGRVAADQGIPTGAGKEGSEANVSSSAAELDPATLGGRASRIFPNARPAEGTALTVAGSPESAGHKADHAPVSDDPAESQPPNVGEGIGQPVNRAATTITEIADLPPGSTMASPPPAGVNRVGKIKVNEPSTAPGFVDLREKALKIPLIREIKKLDPDQTHVTYSDLPGLSAEVLRGLLTDLEEVVGEGQGKLT
jgi:hypothetical protein